MINFKKKKPYDVENMSDEEFSGYIKDAENGKEKLNNLKREEEADSEAVQFNKIKQMAMKLFGTDNAEDALYSLIKTAVDAKKGKPDEDEGDILRQCEQIKEIYPDFNFEELMKNEDFRHIMEQTKNVALAYIKASEKKSVKPQARIVENGTIPYAASGDVRRSPADMSDEEFRKYIDKIGKKSSI